jgi:hypothetical protein
MVDGHVTDRLQMWYAAHCNGDWEHSNRVRISTLDNPGWAVDVNIAETDLIERPFAAIKVDRTDRDWIVCSMSGAVFAGRGGAGNLSEILSVFLNWAERRTP